VGLRPTNGHETPPGVCHSDPAELERNVLLIFFSQKQIPRRYAPRNDRAVTERDDTTFTPLEYSEIDDVHTL